MYAIQNELTLDKLLCNENHYYLGNSFYTIIGEVARRVVKGRLSELPGYFNTPHYGSKYVQPAAYILQHCLDGKIYIGSTGNVYIRMMSHKSNIRMKNHDCEELNELLEFTNLEYFDLILIFTTTRDEAYDCEQYLLDKFKNNPLVLNWAEDARAPMRGRTHSDASKQKLSEFHKTDETAINQFKTILDGKKRKVSVYGVEYSSITEAGKESPYSETFIRRRLNLDYDANIYYLSDNVSPIKGRTLSDERRRQLSEFRKTDPKAIAQLESLREANRCKIVFNGVLYPSILSASVSSDVNEATIRKAARGCLKDAEGSLIVNYVPWVPRKINVDGVVYDSVKAACEKLSLSKDLIKYRIKIGKISYVD